MFCDSIIRLSFESNLKAASAANLVLVGHKQKRYGVYPYEKVGTSTYVCTEGDVMQVLKSITALGKVLERYAKDVDFVSITFAKRAKTE
jgi:hypothetical protein